MTTDHAPQRLTWVLLLDLFLVLVAFAAFRRSCVRAVTPADTALSGGLLTVTGLDPGPDAGFKVGDRVLAIDGQPIESPRQLEFYTNGLSIGDTPTYRLVRSGVPLELKAPLVRFFNLRYLLVQSLVGSLFLFIGLLLYVKRPKDPVAVLLHWDFLLVGVMAMTTPGHFAPPYSGLSRLVDWVFAAGGGLFPSIFLHFGLVFPRRRVSEAFLRRYLWVLYAVALALSTWVGLVTVGVGHPAFQDWFRQFTAAYSASRWFLTLCVVASVFLLILSSFKASGDVERRQMNWILLGLGTGPLIWLAAWQVPILAGVTLQLPEEYALASLATAPVAFAIAIIQYRLLDVDLVLQKGMVYASMAAAAGIFWLVTHSALAAVTAAVLVNLLFEAQERERLNRMKSYFVSGVSHDLKTPLTGIKMYTQMLRDGARTSPAKTRRYLGIIEGETDRLTRLIDNVLNFSRMEKGRREYRLEILEVNRLVRDALQSMAYPLQAGGFTLKKAFRRGPLLIRGDAEALAEAVGNLVDNGLKYSGGQKRLAVSTQLEEGSVGIRVQDWGIGISPEEQGKIFEPFFRSTDPLAHSVGGVGLGLALVKNIVDAHGGQVDVLSVPGQGSVFTLWFPGLEEKA